MSISKKLDETLDNLELTDAARQARDSVISQSMNNLRGKMSNLDIQVEGTTSKTKKEEYQPRYTKESLADTARAVYRSNIKPLEEKAAVEEKPVTIASRANTKAISRAIAGLRTSGNEGKVSPVGPNGTGNVGKISPTGENSTGNVGTNGVHGNYYALTTDMTLEEYEQYVNNIFEGEDCDCKHEKEKEKTKKEIKARGGPPGYPDKSVTKEDVVYELEQRLVTLGSTDWIQVDQVLREMSRELDVAPRTLSREFKSVHGLYPDKWIKEHLEVEMCGYMPLDEAARLNKVGTVYEVTFMFRGGTNRFKFFWPAPGHASKEQMQQEVEKFWPKAKLIAYYPTIDNEMQSNYMVMVPPMTENYKFLQPDEWTEVPEYICEAIEEIADEMGEPISPLLNEEGGYSLWIEDHDTGEESELHLNEEGLRDWFGKSKSKDGKKGWVNVVTGDSCASDKKGEGIPKCVSSAKRDSMTMKERKASAAKKRREDPGQQSKSGASKPTNVKTDVDESVEFSEEKDKKGKGSGKKDACYNKVKSRYSVWPSAYASGALVKCRQKGAANWGSKKEEYVAFGDAYASIYEKMDPKELQAMENEFDAFEAETGGDGDMDEWRRNRNKKAAKPKSLKQRMADGYEKNKNNIKEGLTGARAMRARQMQDSEIKKGGGTRTPQDRDTAFRLGTGTSENRPSHPERKGLGGNVNNRSTYSRDLGKGNAAKRRMNEEEALEELKCWTGYKRKPGSVPGAKGSCVKEDEVCPICNEDPCQCLEGNITEGDEMKGMSQKSGDKRSTESGAGMTAQGVAKYNSRTGGNLKTAVTTPPSKLKPGSKAAGRRKSFCARSRGWTGERGKAARRRWNC